MTGRRKAGRRPGPRTAADLAADSKRTGRRPGPRTEAERAWDAERNQATAERIARARAEARENDRRFGPKARRKSTPESELGRLMLQARRRLDLTMTDVGQACGVGESCVCSWEAGRAQPNASRLWRLVCVLELDAALILRACDPTLSGPCGPSSKAQEGHSHDDEEPSTR